MDATFMCSAVPRRTTYELPLEAKPILFNTEMVRAIQHGDKTVTRRVVKPRPLERAEHPHKINSGNWYFDIPDRTFGGIETIVGPYRPPCHPGDILYVRETWARPYGGAIRYKADYEEHDIIQADIGDVSYSANLVRWRPSIHMPKEAARIFLRVTDVRLERLQDITEEQAEAEGVTEYPFTAIGAFGKLWNSTIKPADRALYGWNANPWVWVIEFVQISKEEAMRDA